MRITAHFILINWFMNGIWEVNAAHDFCFYSQLQAFKATDLAFLFIYTYGKTYPGRDSIAWEKILKPRRHKLFSEFKNIILLLSGITWDRQALQDEIKYGMLTLGLPVIVIYPNIKNESDIARWDSLVLTQHLYGTNYLHSEII